MDVPEDEASFARRQDCVEVVHSGTEGFAVGDAATTRRGLRDSVHGRMNRIGGSATVTSAEGAGTVVRLEWSS